MVEEKSLLERIAGHLVLLAVALMLFLGWRTGLAGSLAGRTEPAATIGEGTPMAGAAAPSVSDTLPAPADPAPAGDNPLVAPDVAPLPVLTDYTLAPDPVPHTFAGQQPEHTFQTYVVERGDTPNGIAEKFGIKPETLLGGNPKLSEESSLLQTGAELIILPVDGVLHDVQPGDTLEGLAAGYGIPAEDIIAYGPNNLEFPYRLYAGTQIVVPGAVREVFVWTAPSLASVTGRSSGEGSGVRPVIVGTGTFRYPVNSRNFTQYYWYGHRGIDIALAQGSPVYASDTGTVTFAGWNNYGFGNLIVVNHGNGYETFYGHLSGINVVPGQIVYQGNLIGLTGNSGNSSGPHIHFEIRLHNNQANPCFHIGGC